MKPSSPQIWFEVWQVLSLTHCLPVAYNRAMKKLSGTPGEAPRLVVRFAPELLTRLRGLAAQDRRALSEYVRLVLEDHIAVKTRKRR